ncbi:ribonuclease H-like domain-containing protein [Tanacetum coccineum]
MSEPMPTIPTQSPFTYPNPNPSASPSFTQDDTSESFIPEPTQPMPTFTQTAFSQPAFSQPNQSIFSQPAVHFQQTQPTQTNQTGQQYPNNVQSQQFQQFQTATISANNAKFPYLEKEKYEIWAMKMEYWIQNADHNLWRIVQQGNSPKRLGKDAKGNTIVHPPVSLDEHVAVQRENKVRTLLLQALPEDHMPDFHHYDDARDIWMAVKARFGGNEESKKMRKTMLKQQFTEFSVTEEEGLHKGYDRFQKILSQLNQVQARPDNDDINLKFLRALPSSWSQVALALKTRGGLDSMSFDDLYNKLRSLELDVRIGHSYGVKAAAAPTHSAFIGAASSGSKPTYSDQQNIVPSVSQTSGRSDNIMECVLHSFVAENEPDQDMIYEDFDQVDQLEMEELDLKWQMAMLSLRINRFEKKAGRKMNYNNQQPARFDRRKVRCYKCLQLGHFARECNVKTVDDKKSRKQDGGSLSMMGDSPKYKIVPMAYQNAVKTLESQKDWYHKTQIALEEKIRVLTANLENTANTLSYTEKLHDRHKKKRKNGKLSTLGKDEGCVICMLSTLHQLNLLCPPQYNLTYRKPDSVPCKSKAASVPAGSRNSPASVTAGGSDPAASRNRPAVNSAGRPNPAGWSKRLATVSAGRPVSAGCLIFC